MFYYQNYMYYLNLTYTDLVIFQPGTELPVTCTHARVSKTVRKCDYYYFYPIMTNKECTIDVHLMASH